MRAIFTAVFRHAFYRRISSPEVSVALNCVAVASAGVLGGRAAPGGKIFFFFFWVFGVFVLKYFFFVFFFFKKKE